MSGEVRCEAHYADDTIETISAFFFLYSASNNALFKHKEDEDLNVFYYERVPFRLPCIPFHPEMQVSLKGAKSNFEFDPTQGFTATIDLAASEITCLATYNGKMSSQTFTAQKLENRMLSLESSNQIMHDDGVMRLTSAVINKQATFDCVMSIPINPDEFNYNISFQLDNNGVRIEYVSADFF